jgi:hypothetical protein
MEELKTLLKDDNKVKVAGTSYLSPLSTLSRRGLS